MIRQCLLMHCYFFETKRCSRLYTPTDCWLSSSYSAQSFTHSRHRSDGSAKMVTYGLTLSERLISSNCVPLPTASAEKPTYSLQSQWIHQTFIHNIESHPWRKIEGFNTSAVKWNHTFECIVVFCLHIIKPIASGLQTGNIREYHVYTNRIPHNICWETQW